MELAFLWMGVGLLTGIIAGSKGRSGVGWFLLGLGFSLLALIAVIAMPALTVSQNTKIRIEPPKVCRKCRTPNSVAFRHCSNCGSELW